MNAYSMNAWSLVERKKITRSPGHEKQQGRQLFFHELLVTASFFSVYTKLVKMEFDFSCSHYAILGALVILVPEAFHYAKRFQ